MTWAEFKSRVEAAGVQDHDEIDYIDMTSAWPMVIERNESGEVIVYYGDDES